MRRLGWCVCLAALLVWGAGSSVQAAHPGLAAQLDVSLQERPPSVTLQHADARQAHLEAVTGTRWQMRWDPFTGAARWGWGGAPVQGNSIAQGAVVPRAEQFLQEHGDLLGIPTVPRTVPTVMRSRRAWHVIYAQEHAGRRVVGGFLNLTLREDGDVVAFHSRWVAPTTAHKVGPAQWPATAAAVQMCAQRIGQALQADESDEVWAIVPTDAGYALRAVRELLVTNEYGGCWKALVAPDAIVSLENQLRFEVLHGTASGDIKPLYAQDVDESRPYAWLQVGADDARQSQTHSDALGNWSLNVSTSPVLVQSPLVGLYASVTNAAGDPDAWFEAETPVPGNLPVHFGPTHARSDERTLYYHTNLIHDWVAAELEFDLMDFPLPVTASVRNPNNGSADYANAFWDGSGISFGNGGGSFPNFGLFADVIYHEYTHGITDFMYRPAGGLPGPLGGALHEGLADYFACTLTDEPLVGENLAGLGGSFRDLDNDLLWPDDRDPGDQVHRNGEIIAGALWDVRLLTGPSVADALVHFARLLHPVDFEEYMQAILVQDDLIYGDGAQANGSPHDDQILTAFAKHGMGPLASREVVIEHDRLADTEEAMQPRVIRAEINSQLPGLVDEMNLYWSVDGSSSQKLTMQAAGGGWETTIPGQADGSEVSYWLEAVKFRPRQEKRLPLGAPVETFSYRVGPDTEPPVVQHAAPTQLPSFAWPATLGIGIEDNLGLARAWIEYRRNGGPVSTMGLVPHADAAHQYRATFPNVGGQTGDQFEYWIVAEDASQAAHVTRLPATGAFQFTMVEVLEDGFEQEAGVWLHRPAVPGRDDPWRITTGANHTPGGQRAWLCGSALGDYPTVTAAELASDWYLLGEGAVASVWSKMDAEPNGPTSAFDGGIVQILVEGDLSPSLLVPNEGYPRTMGETADTNVIPPGTPCLSGTDADWQQLTFDLAAWAGKRVQIRFLFGSDNVASFHSGWLLDDFSLMPGTRNPTDVGDGEAASRRPVLMGPPSPNPFNPNVVFLLQSDAQLGSVLLDIVDARGHRVRRLHSGPLPSETNRFTWDGRDQSGRPSATGVYWYHLRSARGVETGKLVLLR